MKKILAVVLFLVSLMILPQTFASESAEGQLVLPSSLKVIKSEAFYGNQNILHLIIPEGATHIESLAFADTSLTTIVLPKSLTFIAGDAFRNCPLQNITVAQNSYAEAWCVNQDLPYEVQGQTNPSDFTITELSDGTAAVSGYTGTSTEIILPPYINGKRVTRITNSAFEENTAIQSVRISRGVTHIGEYAFSGCTALSVIELPDSLLSIGDLAFQMCRSLTEITIPESTTALGWNVFNSCTSLQHAYIPSSVRTVDTHSIQWSEDGKSITVAGDILDYTFSRWTEVESVILTDSTTLGEGAFSSCYALQRVSLPDSLTSIGNRAFLHCRKLKEINIPPQIKVLDDYTFCGTALETLELPEGLTTLKQRVFEGCSQLAHLSVPANVSSIADDAFNYVSDSFCMTVVENSPAHLYAQKHNIPFELNTGAAPTLPPADLSAFQYTVDETAGTCTITYYSGAHTTVVVPEEINGYAVTSIGARAFTAASMQRIILPSALTSIGEYAFNMCTQLTEISIPAGASCGASAFNNCTSLKKAVLSEGMTEIPDQLFTGCTALEEVHFPSTITTIGSYVFSGCTNLTGIELPQGITSIPSALFENCAALKSMIIPAGVTTISYQAFAGCSALEQVEIPASVTFVGMNAFAQCARLQDIYIPETVFNIHSAAFDDCPLLVISCIENSAAHTFAQSYGHPFKLVAPPAKFLYTADESSKTCVITGVQNVTEKLEIPSMIDGYRVTGIGDHAFASLYSITSVDIAEGITAIGSNAFFDCANLQSVVLPQSLTSIGEGAFYCCTSLTGIVFPSNSLTLGINAFKSSGLLSVSIPEGWTSIPQGAFENCLDLKQAGIPSTLKSIGMSAFSGCTNLTGIVLPAGMETIGQAAFSGSGLRSIYIPGSVSSIGRYAFSNCSALSTVLLSEGLREIGHYAFQDSGLSAITVPGSVTSWMNAFAGCARLSSATLSPGLAMIDSSAFSGCAALSRVDISNGLHTISPNAFAGCTSLKKLSLPESIVSFGSDMFDASADDCVIACKPGGMTAIRAYLAGIPVVSSQEQYTVPEGLTYAVMPKDYSICITGYTGSSPRLIIPDYIDCMPVCSISANAFAGNSVLNSIELPSFMSQIGASAFSGCSSLLSVTFADELQSPPTNELRASAAPDGMVIGRKAFSSSAIRSISLPEYIIDIGADPFDGCNDLTAAEFKSGFTSFSTSLFNGCGNLSDLYLPETLADINFDSDDSMDSVLYHVYKNSQVYKNYFHHGMLLHCLLDLDDSKPVCNAFYESSHMGDVTKEMKDSVTTWIEVNVGEYDMQELCIAFFDADTLEIVDTVDLGIHRGCLRLQNSVLCSSIFPDFGKYYAALWGRDTRGLSLDGETASVHDIDPRSYPYSFMVNVVAGDTTPPWLSDLTVDLEEHYLYITAYDDTGIRDVQVFLNGNQVSLSWDDTASAYELLHLTLDLYSVLGDIDAATCEIIVKVWDRAGLCTSNEDQPLVLNTCPHPEDARVSEGNRTVYTIQDELTHNGRTSYVYTCSDCGGISATTGWETFTEAHIWDQNGKCLHCGYQNHETAPDNTVIKTAISGRVTGSFASPLEGVSVTVFHGTNTTQPFGTALTGSDGKWMIENAVVGNRYLVRFEKDGYSFDPAAVQIDVLTDGRYITAKGVSTEESEELYIIYPTAGSIVPAASMTIRWTEDPQVLYHTVSIFTGDAPVFTQAEHFGTSLTVHAGVLQAGQSYRIQIDAYDEQDNRLYTKHQSFTCSAAGTAVPGCSVTSGKQTLELGQYFYFTGRVNSGGGALNRISIDIINTAGDRCYYKTYDADAIISMSGTLAQFDLSSVPPLQTGVVIPSDHHTEEETAKTIDLTQAGDYRIRVWAYNESAAEAHIVSTQMLTLVPRASAAEPPRILSFQTPAEPVYKNTWQTISAQTSASVVKVEVYVDGYLLTPEITETEWSGSRYYTIRAMIHEPGKRTLELRAYDAAGTWTSQTGQIEILNTDYIRLDTPRLVSPEIFTGDSSVHGVAASPFTLQWTQPGNHTADSFSVRIWSDASKSYTFSQSTSAVTLYVPETALPEPGEYILSVIAMQAGYDNSDPLIVPIVAFSTYQDAQQAECSHSRTEKFNKRIQYRDHSILSSAGHYIREVFDLRCASCGMVVQRSATDAEYQLEKHSLSYGGVCSCGYCSDDTSMAHAYGFINSRSTIKVYRAPDVEPGYGKIYPGESVTVVAVLKDWLKVSYSTPSGYKRGYIKADHFTENATLQFYTDDDGSYLTEDYTARYINGSYFTTHYNLDQDCFSEGTPVETVFIDMITPYSLRSGWELHIDFTGAKEGDTKEIPVTSLAPDTVPPIATVTAKWLSNTIYLEVKDLCALCNLRLIGNMVVLSQASYVSVNAERLEKIKRDWKELFESFTRDSSGGAYSALTTFQADVWPSIFYMGVWDGIRYDCQRLWGNISGEHYDGDLIVREMLMRKTLEYDNEFGDAVENIQTALEGLSIAESVDQNILKSLYSIVSAIIKDGWDDDRFDSFAVSAAMYIELFEDDLSHLDWFESTLDAKIFLTLGPTWCASGNISMLRNVCNAVKKTPLRYLNAGIKDSNGSVQVTFIELVGDLLSVASAADKELQWNRMENVYKEVYLEYLNQWIAVESDAKMKRAYQNVMNEMQSNLADVTGFMDKTLIDTGIARKYSTKFLDYMVSSGKFGDKIKGLWIKAGAGPLAIVNFADTVAEGILFVLKMSGIDLADAKICTGYINTNWNTYDTNVKQLVKDLANINSSNYKQIISKMELCVEHLENLWNLMAKQKEASWDLIISEVEVTTFRESCKELLDGMRCVIAEYSEMLEEYYMLTAY